MKNNLSIYIFSLMTAIVISGCFSSSQELFPESPASESVLNSSVDTSLLSEILMHLQLDYSDRKKLAPLNLLEGALTEAERAIPELRFSFKPKKSSNPEQKEIIQIYHGNQQTEFVFQAPVGLYDLNRILNQLLQTMVKQTSMISDEPKRRELQLERMLAQGIMNQLDPYSVLLANEVYREFRINIGGQFAGIGLVVGTQGGQLSVISPMDDSPAAKAGIKPMDRIIGINGEETEFMTLDEILYQLRGKIGTMVRLEIRRKGEPTPLLFELKRNDIQVESVESSDIQQFGKNFRYLRIKTFQTDTSQEIKNKLNKLDEVSGIILDLRNNPGGLLEEAIRASDLFLPGNKRIVSTRGASVSSVHYSKKLFNPQKWQNIPLVVLVNKGSASASEIVSAALKQNKRALLLGEQSYGKGTIQTLWNLKKDFGLKLTIGEYLTPNGRSIHLTGVSPHIHFVPLLVSDSESKKEAETDSLSSKEYLRFHLLPDLSSNDDNQSTREKIYYLLRREKEDEDFAENNSTVRSKKFNEDIYIQMAVRFLKNESSILKPDLMQQTLNDLKKEEHEKIIASLREKQIDWNFDAALEPVSADDLQMSWSFKKLNQDRIRLSLKLKNNSQRTGQKMIAILKSGNDSLNGLEFPFGKINPQQTMTREIDFKYSPALFQSNEPLQWLLYDSNLKKIKSLNAELQFPEKHPTSLQLRLAVHDDGQFGSQGNADGKIQIGETIALGFHVKNSSPDQIQSIQFRLKRNNDRSIKNSKVRIGRGKIKMEGVESGAEKQDHMLFRVMDDSDQLGKLKLEMDASQSRNQNLELELDLAQEISSSWMQTPVLKKIFFEDAQGNEVRGSSQKKQLQLKALLSQSQNFREWVVFLNNKKIFYSNKTSELDLPVLLKEGKNLLVLMLRDQNGFTAKHKMRVLLQP